jgi:hypothetical protein
MNEPLDPATLCRALLDAIEASDGRRRKRKRDTTADSIGLSLKRELIERAVREAPSGEDFEAWLCGQCESIDGSASGPVRAVALELFDEWRLAQQAPDFRAWLVHGAPSDDAEREGRDKTSSGAG